MTLVSRLAGALAALPPARTRQVSVERDLVVPMADGVALKFLDAPLSRQQLGELIQIPPP